MNFFLLICCPQLVGILDDVPEMVAIDSQNYASAMLGRCGAEHSLSSRQLSQGERPSSILGHHEVFLHCGLLLLRIRFAA